MARFISGSQSGAERPSLVERPSLIPIRVGGPDRIDFLHGQLSNDVRGLQVGHYNRTLQLSHRGHVLASALLFRRSDDVYLAVEAGGELLLDSLRRHVIFDQVEIEDLRATLAAVTLLGGATEEVLAEMGVALPEAGRFAQVSLAGAAVLLNASPWTGGTGADLHLLQRDRDRVVTALRDLGVEPVPASELDRARVEAGVATAADAGEGVLPQEIGLEVALSYRKGCYLGQEIMARIEARGRLRRSAARVRLDGTPPDGERDLVAGDRRVGRLGLVVADPGGGAAALATLRSDLAEGLTVTVGGRTLLGVERL